MISNSNRKTLLDIIDESNDIKNSETFIENKNKPNNNGSGKKIINIYNNDKNIKINPYKIEFLSWDPITFWKYNVEDDNPNCGICLCSLTKKCNDCMKSNNIISTKCSISRGKCGHVFHYHCINSWLNKGSVTCPIDQTPWNYNKLNLDDISYKVMLNNKDNKK